MATLEPAAQAVRSGGRVGRAARARILQAAERVFAQAGFEGATTAAIAEAANVPKANVHYYFATKELLYRAVLEAILAEWLAAFEGFGVEDDPATALRAYIVQKMRQSHARPDASRVFAQEMLRGAPAIRDFLEGELKGWVARKGDVLRAWAEAGRIDPVEPADLFFLIWAATQTYADFLPQILAVTGRTSLSHADIERAADAVASIVLKGIGATEAK